MNRFMTKKKLDDATSIYIGYRADIKRLYGRMLKKEGFCPLTLNFPKFSEKKDVYGILVDDMEYSEDGNWDGCRYRFQVITNDTILELLFLSE